MKKILTVLMLLSVFLLVVACSKSVPETPVVNEPTTDTTAVPETSTVAAPTGAVSQVVIENFKFMPTDLTVKVGDTIEWVNKDTVPHTVTLDNGDFDQELTEGGAATYTFTQKGEFSYFCSFHPSMRGSIVIE